MVSTASPFDRQLAYAIFRLTLGINILVHGAGRIFGSGSQAFAAKTSAEFIGMPLPHSLVYVFLVTLPLAEAIVGLLLTFGLFTRWALALGGLLMAALVFGTVLRSDWPTVGIQMIHAIAYYLLLANVADDSISLDALLRKSHN